MSGHGVETVGYFGFGSLVNRHTLRTNYVDIVPASLKGWRRHWQARARTLEENIALLSIHRDPECEIKGMMVIDLAENLEQVDEREEGYSRMSLSPDDLLLPAGFTPPDELYVYVANEVESVQDTGALLQSYMDAVLQGFRNEYGDDGVWHFVETTSAFQRPLIADRENPIYPRSVTLHREETELFDLAIRQAGVSGHVSLHTRSTL